MGVLSLTNGGTATGTKVILEDPSKSKSSVMRWLKKTVNEDQWFHLKPLNLEKFLTAENNNLTTVTGTYYLLSLMLIYHKNIAHVALMCFSSIGNMSNPLLSN